MSERAQAERQMRLRLRLTERWTPLKPHPMQALYFWSPVRFKVVPPGRRSGKTENAKRKAVRDLVRWRKWPARILCGAPTHEQARSIWWDDLKALIPREWLAGKPNETRLELVTKWGAMIRVFGFNRPERAEGVVWDWLYLDEMADCPPDCFKRNIRPMLSTIGREGGADLLGVPDEDGPNQAEYEKLWKTGLAWKPGQPPVMDGKPEWDPEVCSFHWPSWDILDPSEVESARRSLDELSFLQEYGGRFVRSGGKALPRFDYAAHVREEYCEYQPWLPLDWSLDFGKRWVGHVIAQHYRGRLWVLDEIALEHSNTEAAVEDFIERCRARGWSTRRINVYGDASGRNPNQTTGPSDYEYVAQRLAREHSRVEWKQLEHNPLVKDTLNAVRCKVATVDNMVHLHLHPRCEHLIGNCQDAPWPDPKRLADYHWLAALRYLCYGEWGDPMELSVGPTALPNVTGSSGEGPKRMG